MAAILKGGLTRDDPKLKHKEPQGEREEFYLGRSIRGVHVSKPQAVPVSINGFTRYAVMGEDNEMERQFVDVIEQSASSAMVPDMDQYNPERGGRPRPQNLPAQMKVEYLGDYELRREKDKRLKRTRHQETITVPGGLNERKVQSGPRKFQPVLEDTPDQATAAAAPSDGSGEGQ